MPLKFLKKCRQYNVTSKSLFVISVHHLLDTSTTVDCTISSESKGQECLDNVCQRLLIQQPEFFGLRYLVKGKEDEYKWIDLERSLSRQLEKYAASTKIFLRVRHYVTTGIRHLNDEVTRYYYFLQLKSDIYEGKIACDIRTAILLALYCRQAEYDSYQGEKQTKDYLKKSLVLPRNLQGLANDDNMLDTLIVEVLQQNAGIAHLTQNPAEEMYIQCCQTLEGYGEERFQAKDTLGNDLLLGLAINGMVVHADNGRQYFPWKDFHTVTIDKRTIKIEQNKVDGDGSIVGSFIFTEADMARYFWKLCITSHKFFKRCIDTDVPSSVGSAGDVESANGEGYAYEYSDGEHLQQQHHHQQQQQQLHHHHQQQQQQQQRAIYGGQDAGLAAGMSSGGLSAASQREEFMSAQSLPQQLPHGLMASANSSSALMSSNISLAASQQSGNGVGGGGGGGGVGSASGQGWLNKDYAHDYVSSQLLSHSMLDTRLGQSSSCLDLSNNNLHSSSTSMLAQSNSNSNNNHLATLTADAHERERLKAMLPTYRPAPDYETAVQLKYRTPSAELHNLNTMHTYHAGSTNATALGGTHGSAAAYYAGSQPDVHNPSVYADGMLLGHLTAHRYPDVAQPAVAMHAHHHLNAAAAAIQQQGHHPHQHSGYIDLPQRMHIMRHKAPPPYPVNRLSSSSTPDLAVASHRPLLGYRAYVSGSSPDLVSNRNMLNSSQYPYGAGGTSSGINAIGAGHTMHTTSSGATMLHQYPYIGQMGHSQPFLPPHGTFENLNMIEEQPSIMSQLRQSALSQAAAAQAVSQGYEQHSPTLPPSGYRGSASSQLNAAASASTQQQQQSQSNQANSSTQQQQQPQPLQRSAMNGSIEPIYENVPLPQYTTATTTTTPQRNSEQRSSRASSHHNSATHNGSHSINDSMRNRAPSIQSAPGVVMPVPAARHHHQQQQQQQSAVAAAAAAAAAQHNNEPDEVSMNIKKFGSKTHVDRAASTDLQLLEPTPPQRTMRAASAAPTIGSGGGQPPAITQTPPPRQHRSNIIKHFVASSGPAIDVISPTSTATLANTRHASASHDDSLHKQFNAMNLSSSASSTSMFNTTLDTTTSTLNNTNTTTSSKDVKRKKRWNILGRSKTPDKQKSATLGREKAAKSEQSKIANKMKLAQDDLNLPHRWSTGVPKLQPISGQYSKDKLCQILDSKLNDAQLFMEFERIPKRRELARYDCALLEENALKNSDPNFLPYDDNRVRITPTMDNRHGYVNASHISATVGTKQRFYIVAQSPQEEFTTRIFWQCVWEADVYLVVQLSDELSYIPPNTNQSMEFGQFQVYQEFSQTTDRCTTSKLRLYHTHSRRYRSVWHLQYADWAEQNCPREVNHFLEFLEELNSVRLASTHEVPPGHNTNPPVLIHCHEGGGRSGVTLTADLLLYTLDHNEDLDIPRVIGQLRHQRDSIIPSLAQYKFIYSLLITYLKRTRLI